MPKKKPVKKDPNRIPKTYIIPSPSDGIKDGEIPSLAEDAYRLIERFAKRHTPDVRLQEQEINRLIDMHTDMHDAYQEAMIQNGLALSAENLLHQDRIDLTFLADETAQWAMPEIPSVYLKQMKAAMPEKPEEQFYCYLPCFQSGVLKVNIGRLMYFEITDLNLDEQTAKINVTDYILDNDQKCQIGRSVILAISTRQVSPNLPQKELPAEYLIEGFTPNAPGILNQYRILESSSFADLYTILPPKALKWTRPMVKFWEAVTLQNAVDQDEKFRRCGIDPADQLARYFIQGICLSNYFLTKHRPVLLDKQQKPQDESVNTTKSKSTPTLAPIDPNQPIKHIRKVGVIQFISNKPPRKPNQKTARQYHVAVWTVRGHVRKYANGKTVYIKPTVKHRKALQNHINSRPQNIIEFHDNAKEVAES